MTVLNLLSNIGVNSFGEGFGAIGLDWIGNIIYWIINIAKDVGLGIILFTIALKLITLPLDVFSRVSMKKNSLKMEMMKGDLEKLQKQYANNKELYQQKMMALYKKNGYSAFSACLPTILTLVFFFIVLGGFNTYSRYTEKEVFNEMGRAYTESVASFSEDGSLVSAEDGSLEININKALSYYGYGSLFDGYSDEKNPDVSSYGIDRAVMAGNADFLEKFGLKEYFDGSDYNLKNTAVTDVINAETQLKIISLLSDEQRASATEAGYISNAGVILDFDSFYNFAKDEVGKYFEQRERTVSADGGETETVRYYAIDFAAVFGDHDDLKTEFYDRADKSVAEKAVRAVAEKYRREVIYAAARNAASDAYRNGNSHSAILPWIKNIWVVDSPFSPAIKTYSNFTSSVRNDVGSLTENAYDEITYNLSEEKETGFGKGNGWFILVALSILSMLGSTFITNKTQKNQVQLSTVDGASGTAASSQKMMMWMMPIMFGIFAFIYSAAFSVYMIVSTLFSLASTLLINFLVERAFRKKIEKDLEEKYSKQKYGKRR